MSDDRRSDDRAWADFWQTNARSAIPVKSTGCLPQRLSAIEDAQRACWAGIATRLPKAARVLDLATGNGCVMRWMLSARSDLKLIGVDLAPTLPEPPRGTQSKSGVKMENLPFPAKRFHAVTSQFGFEYGDIASSAAEVARVLGDDSLFAVMVHRGDGPILEHNRQRRDQITWLLDDRKLEQHVKSALTLGLGGGRAALAAAESAVREAASKYGTDGPGWEIAEATRRTIIMGARSGAQSIMVTLGTITSQARNEVGRIDSLERACGVADDREDLLAKLEAAGLEQISCEPVEEPGGRAFADFLIFEN